MGKDSLLPFPMIGLFLRERVPIQNPRCIDFTKELERSLDLFQLGSLASYFPQTVAATTALLVYVFFLKAFAKPKTLLALLSLPITYITVSLLISFLIKNALSYCY